MIDSAHLDRNIQQRIDQSVLFYATLGREQIDVRLKQLEQEWDLDRWLLTLMGGISVAALVTGGMRKNRWSFLGGLLGGFLLTMPAPEHPAMVFLRSLGIRTQVEIDREKFALRALRGDMDEVRDDLHEALSQAIGDLDNDEGPPVSH